MRYGLRLTQSKEFEGRVFREDQNSFQSQRSDELRLTRRQYSVFPRGKEKVEPGLLERLEDDETAQWYRRNYTERRRQSDSRRQQLCTGFVHTQQEIQGLQIAGKTKPHRAKSLCCNSGAILDFAGGSTFFLTEAGPGK